MTLFVLGVLFVILLALIIRRQVSRQNTDAEVAVHQLHLRVPARAALVWSGERRVLVGLTASVLAVDGACTDRHCFAWCGGCRFCERWAGRRRRRSGEKIMRLRWKGDGYGGEEVIAKWARNQNNEHREDVQCGANALLLCGFRRVSRSSLTCDVLRTGRSHIVASYN